MLFLSYSRKSTLMILFSLFLILFLGRYLLPLFLPFLLGAGLALAAEPLVCLLRDRLHLPGVVSAAVGVTLAFSLLAALLLTLAALAVQQLKAAADLLPALEAAVCTGIDLIYDWLLDLASMAPKSIRPLLQSFLRDSFQDGTALLRKAGAYGLALAGGILTRLPNGAISLGTTLLSGYMISAKLPALRRKLQALTLREKLGDLFALLKKMRSTVGKWLLAQLKLMTVTWAILSCGFFLLKIPFAPFWAAGLALLDALPLLGTGVVLLPWSLICLLRGSSLRALGLLCLYLGVMITRTILEPRLVGKQLGLDPLAALASLYIGFQLWGVAGMFLSPLLTVTAIQLFSGEKPYLKT